MGVFYWFLSNNENQASVRMQSIRLHRLMVAEGYHSEMIQKPDFFTTELLLNRSEQSYFVEEILQEGDVVAIHKLNSVKTTFFAELVKSRNAHLIYITCDYPINIHLTPYADLVVVPSKKLLEIYQDSGYNNVQYLPDAPERFINPKINDNNDQLRCVWFGTYDPKKWESYTWLKNLLKENFGNKIIIESICDSTEGDKKWNKNSFEDISRYDLVVLPSISIGKDELIKSSNKLLQSMALGMPVLASPIPSYLEELSTYGHEIICWNEEDWIEKVKKYLKADYRNSLANYNFNYVLQNYTERDYLLKFKEILFRDLIRSSNIDVTLKNKTIRLKRRLTIKSKNIENLLNYEGFLGLIENPIECLGLFRRTIARANRLVFK